MIHVSRRHSLCVVLVLVALLWSAPGFAQAAPVVRIVSVDTTRLPTVELTVSYTDPAALPLQPPAAFEVSLGDTPVAGVSVSSRELPLAAVVVADLSSRMSDRGTPTNQRFGDMQPQILRLISQLPPQSQASLIAFKQTVIPTLPFVDDLGRFSNVVNNADQEVSFGVAPLAEDAPGSPYPLEEAIRAGLDQLAQVDPARPRVLAVFAAGDPGRQVEVATLRPLFEEAVEARRPIRLLVFGFGSDDPAAAERFPANTAALRAVAEDLGGTFIQVGPQPLAAAEIRQINDVVASVRDLSVHQVLTFEAGQVAPGPARITVRAGAGADTGEVDFPPIPPRFSVVADTRTWQDKVRLTVDVRYVQTSLDRVEYLLNNVAVAPPVAGGDSFELVLDVYAAAFQADFPPGEYELSAAAWDTSGNESRSEQSVSVTVFAPPPRRGLLPPLPPFWWAPLLVVGLIGVGVGGFFLARRARPRPLPAPAVFSPDEPTNRYGSGAVTRRHDEPSPVASTPAVGAGVPKTEAGQQPLRPATGRATAHLQPYGSPITDRLDEAQLDEHTLPFDPGLAAPVRRWYVAVIEGAEPRRIDLPPEQRHFDIGRPTVEYRPHIAVDNRLVSRYHAKIELSHDRLELIAGEGETNNGTFVGERGPQRRLAPGERVTLRPGDMFWITPRIKLIVNTEDSAG